MRAVPGKVAAAGLTRKRTAVVPSRQDEITALLREARAWAESGLPPVASRYSTRFWLPVIRPALWSLVHVMRDDAFARGAVVNGWGLCQLSHQELATRLGVERWNTILRLLKDPGLDRLLLGRARLPVAGTNQPRPTTTNQLV